MDIMKQLQEAKDRLKERYAEEEVIRDEARERNMKLKESDEDTYNQILRKNAGID